MTSQTLTPRDGLWWLYDVIVLLLPLCVTSQTVSANEKYAVMVDAGSSGTRVNVYQWTQPSTRYVLPSIKKIYKYKVKPGVSYFADHMTELGGHVTQLVDHARDNVPQEQHAQTVFLVMATAGMRFLLEDKANAVMERIDEILLNKTLNPFMYESRYTRILSGEEEGAFAWITVNYLRGYFKPKGSSTEPIPSVGILEMGGGSMQIAFQTENSILADKFPVKIGGVIYPLYVHSYLNYGAEYASTFVREKLYRENRGADIIDSPCMPAGATQMGTVYGEEVTFQGTGQPESCITYINDLVYKVPPYRCYPKPCSIGSVYQPTLDPDKEYYALSALSHVANELHAIGENDVIMPKHMLNLAMDYCSKTMDQIMNETGRTDDFIADDCFMGLYIPILETRGFGFDNSTKQIKSVSEINGQALEWTLGAIIYEYERIDRPCPVMGASMSITARPTVTPSVLYLTLTLIVLHIVRDKS